MQHPCCTRLSLWYVRRIVTTSVLVLLNDTIIRSSSTFHITAVAFAISTTTSNHCFGAASLAGTDPDRPGKVNQDRWLFTTATKQEEEKSRPPLFITGVLDGHGRNGHLVTDYLQQQLPHRIKDCLQHDHQADFSIWEAEQRQDLIRLGGADPLSDVTYASSDRTGQALMDAFFLAHLDARRAEGIPAGRSGSTAVVCVSERHKDSSTITTAAVGDSMAYLIPSHNSNSPAIPLCTPTTVQQDADERARIQKRGEGRIDANGNVFYGPIGIAMTRSLGNAVMLRAGVLPVPKITVRNTTITNSISGWIVCCTDGISDVFSEQTLADLVRAEVGGAGEQQEDAMLSSVATNVCAEARKLWLADLPIEPRVDDCTMTILQLPLTSLARE